MVFGAIHKSRHLRNRTNSCMFFSDTLHPLKVHKKKLLLWHFTVLSDPSYSAESGQVSLNIDFPEFCGRNYTVLLFITHNNDTHITRFLSIYYNIILVVMAIIEYSAYSRCPLGYPWRVGWFVHLSDSWDTVLCALHLPDADVCCWLLTKYEYVSTLVRFSGQRNN